MSRERDLDRRRLTRDLCSEGRIALNLQVIYNYRHVRTPSVDGTFAVGQIKVVYLDRDLGRLLMVATGACTSGTTTLASMAIIASLTLFMASSTSLLVSWELGP